MTKLKSLRVRAGLSQEQLSRSLDCSRQTIVNMETGVAVPRVDNALQVAAALGVTVEELWRLDGTPK